MSRIVPCRRDDPDKLAFYEDGNEAVKRADLPPGQSAVPYVPPRELADKPTGTWLRAVR